MREPKIAMTLVLVLCALMAAPVIGQERVTYFHNDALGSPVAATDADGDLVWTESYLPYGERTAREVSTAEHSAFFTGKPHDDETGLTYLGARDYDPLLGRFMGMDPVGFDDRNIQSFNKFAYGNNNPYRFVDPDGAEAFAVGLGDVPENAQLTTGVKITAAVIASPLLLTPLGQGLALDIFADAVAPGAPIPSRSKLLRRGLITHLENRAKKEGFQDHHIASNRNPLTNNHEALRAAGIPMNSRLNKIRLPKHPDSHPTRSIHRGRHDEAVSLEMKRELDDIWTRGRAQGWPKREFNRVVRKTLAEERQRLRSGDRALNSVKRPWAK